MGLFTRSISIGFLFAVFTAQLHAQVTLFAEDFNNCALSPGWNVNSVGNQNPVWYVGNSVLNDDNTGQSMNGSCFLFIDDDATGDQTPAYVIDFVTPAFDASQYSTTQLSVDIHYRDWADGNESFKVLVTDGSNEYLISRFDQNRKTGNNLDEIITVKYDLSLLTKSPNARLIFRYDDANAYNWWTGIDNILVQGYGTGKNIIAESFNSCTQPAGWESEILTGTENWKFGLITSGQALNNGNSMDGTCFVFFDDDVLGNDAPFSAVRLKTPWFDGTQFSEFEVNFDVILRYYSEKMRVYVQHSDGSEYLVQESNEDIGGPFFGNYVSNRLDISAYRAEQMRIVFEYDDGKDFGWWVGLDNVKVTGSGVANDICTNAVPLYTGLNCLPGNTLNSLFDGPNAPCTERSSGGLWYRWKADFTGTARLSTQADFNDVVTIFTGDCNNPVLVQCDNRDEHGFTGENAYFQVQNNSSYLLRVSGTATGFGKSKGNLCVALNNATLPTAPANDPCAGAVALTVNAATTISGNNQNATMSATQPSLNELARADIWYQFVAPAFTAGTVLDVISNANFSDIITVYSGACTNLTEVAGNHNGQQLEMNTWTTGQTYRVQIAGTFATVEGSIKPQVRTKTVAAPANDACSTAQAITPGQACVAGTITKATISNRTPPCVPSIGGDVWYQFTAPLSGSVRVNTGADFEHILALWTGDCANLTNVACYKNPLYCNGGVTLGALLPGYTYYIQIAALLPTTTPAKGDFCLRLTNGANPPDVLPLALTVLEKCTDVNTAKLQITASGGLVPYIFQGNQNNDILTAGESYLVVVSDGRGCETSISGVVKPCVALNCAVSGMLSTVSTRCVGSADGALSATVTGGLAPYIYQWSNGGTTAQITDLKAGIYTVTIIDALGCELTVSSNLLDPTPIFAVPGTIVPPSAGVSNGAIFVDVSGGVSTYMYQWFKDGVLVSNAEDLTNAPAGDYNLIITDANGCTAAFDFTLSEMVSNNDLTVDHYTEIFPNPAREKAWLTVSFATPRTLYLSLTDGSGRVLRAWTQRNVSEQNIPLDLKQLPAGTYQLVIRTDREVIVEQLVIGK